MRTSLWVGLDVGADTMACCVVDDKGEVTLETSLATVAADLKKVLSPYRRRLRLIAMESGATGTHLARKLLRFGLPVAVFDARQVSKFLGIRQNKTDRNDARGIAEVARLGRHIVSEVRLKDVEVQHLRSALAMRQRLVRIRVGAEAAMRSLFRLNGGRLERARTAKLLRRNVTQELTRLRRVEKLDLRERVEPILTLCENLRVYLEQLDKEIAASVEQNPVCQRFMEIPGVGPICALSFYTAIGEPFRFERSADVGAYLGMTPRILESGQATARLRISKMGSKMTRTHLVTAAMVHLRLGKSAIRDWGISLRERSGSGRARVAVARKLAIVMLAMWKSGRPYEPYPPSYSTKHDLPLWKAAGSEAVT